MMLYYLFVKIGSYTPYFHLKSGVILRIFNAKLVFYLKPSKKNADFWAVSEKMNICPQNIFSIQ